MNKVIFSILILIGCFGCTNSYYSDFANHEKISIGKAKKLKVINKSELEQLIIKNQNIEILILDSINLDSLPSSIQSLKNLKHISLANNPNLNFNQALAVTSRLHNLIFINLSKNRISVLPKSFVKNDQIIGLRLSFNTIQPDSLSAQLSSLKKLKRIWLDNNSLKSFPSNLAGFKHIVYLYAYQNEIKEIPSNFNEMKKLWEIHLGNNLFTELPHNLIMARGLKMAFFNDNLISKIPMEFKKKTGRLAALSLNDNLLSVEEIANAKKYFRKFWLLEL